VAGPLQIVVSQIVNPLGLVLAQANQDREEVIKAHLDTGCIADSEIRRDYLARFSGHTAG
jgi:predicted amidohydrolase